MTSSDPTVQQDGVIAECISGTLLGYYDWWETYPGNSVQVMNQVQPGDVISAVADYTTSGSYTLGVSDLTRPSSSFSVSEPCGSTTCEDQSAEWITEAPCCEGGTTPYPMPDFGTDGSGSAYTGVTGSDYATYDGTNSPISSTGAPTLDEITMVDSSHAVKATPSSLSTDGSSFAVSYGTAIPSITLSPTSGSSGTSVTATGSDFVAGSSVGLSFAGTSVGSTTPDSAGAFSKTFSVPAGAASGANTVTARGGGGSETASATFTVGSTGAFTFAATVACTPAAIDLGASTSCTVTVVGDSTHMGHNLGITFHTTDSGSFSPSASCNTAGTGTTTTCSVTYTPGAAGTWTISAHSGNANWPTTDPTFSLPVSSRSTSTAVACVPTSVAVNAATVCTATVTDTDSGTATTPTGTASFSTGGGVTSRFTPDTCSLGQVSTGVSSCEVVYSPAPGTEATHNIEADYSGDATHSNSTSPLFAITATTRDTSTSVACSPSTVPVSSPTTCTATVTDTDTGVTMTPTGGVDFSTDGGQTLRFTPSSCTLAQVSAGVASCSVSYSPATPTTHKIAASYDGDTDHAVSAATPFVVTATSAAPTIATIPQPTSVVLNGSPVTLTDTATLAGGSSPTGTITFTLHGPGGVVDTETVTVNGDGFYQTPIGYNLPSTGPVTGTYQWNAAYSGDSSNNPVSDTGAANEQVTVSQASPAITTTTSEGLVILGGSSVTLTDSATLTGGYYPTGTITFALFFNGGSTPVDTETVTATGASTYNTPTGYTLPTTGTVTGTYQWDATYTGDANNIGASDVNALTEQITVNPASPSIVTTPSPTTVAVGITPRTLTDSATLSGGYHEGGALTFLLQGPGGSTLDTETVTVTGDGTYTTPTGFTISSGPSVAGIYRWTVAYSGDGNNAAATGSNPEPVVVTEGVPTLTTTATPTSVTLGASSPKLTDSATIAGGISPTGTLTFTLSGPGSSVVDTETVTVTGDGTYSTPVGYVLPSTGTVVGTYQWDATYSGDGSNVAVSDTNAVSEQTAVSPASPTLVTTSSPASANLGSGATTLKDAATLAGGYFPQGAITFTLQGPGGLVDTETVMVSGDGTYQTPVGFTLPGTGVVAGSYQWNAVYSGDPNNSPVSDVGASNEQTAVTPASPSIVTSPSPASANLGAGSPTLKDTATLAGGYSETGTITFTLTAPGGATVDTETVTASGNGAYSTPIGYKLPSTGLVAGTYQWSATYSGDSNNIAVSETGATGEQVSVSPAQTTISTALSASTILASYSATDSASVGGGYSPTGTVSFYYSTSNSCPTATATEVGAPVSLGAKSAAATFPTYGTYYWYAVYSGDSNNLGSTSSCEPLNVQDFGLVATPATVNIVAGTSGSSTISLSNLGGFSGTVALAIPSPVAGLASTLAPVSIGGSATSTLTVSTPFAGTYSLTITGATTNGLGETVQHQAIVTVVVSYKSCPQVTNNGGQNLKDANLEYCNLSGLNMSGDNLQNANLQYTNLQGTNLKGANLQNANLANSNAGGANFQGANLQTAIFSNSNIAGDNFQGVNLQGANLAGDSASGADFQGANLQTANLSGGDFDHVNFQGANLQKSNMSNGDFNYAEFQGANTQDANITGATFVGATNPP